MILYGNEEKRGPLYLRIIPPPAADLHEYTVPDEAEEMLEELRDYLQNHDMECMVSLWNHAYKMCEKVVKMVYKEGTKEYRAQQIAMGM